MTKVDDLALVAQVVVFHRKKAFDRLVVKYQSPVRRFFLHQTHGNEMLSDDLAQETFIKAYTHLDQFRGTASFSTWLYRIAYNVFLSDQRAQRPTSDIDQLASVKTGSVSQSSRIDLYKALEVLNPAERTCITLQFMEGQTLEDIARITGIALGTVKANLSRGKHKMANFLRQNGYEGNG